MLRGLVQHWRPVPPDQATVAERYVSITEFDTTETLRANVDATVARWVEAHDLAVADVEYGLQVRESNADTTLPELRAHVVRLAELWLDAIAERVG